MDVSTTQTRQAEWLAARGQAPVVDDSVKAQFMVALRDRQRRIIDPPPLLFCGKCGVKARGTHREAFG